MTTLPASENLAKPLSPSFLAYRLLAAGFRCYQSFFLIKFVVFITVRGEKGKLFCGFWFVGGLCANRKCAWHCAEGCYHLSDRLFYFSACFFLSAEDLFLFAYRFFLNAEGFFLFAYDSFLFAGRYFLYAKGFFPKGGRYFLSDGVYFFL